MPENESRAKIGELCEKLNSNDQKNRYQAQMALENAANAVGGEGKENDRKALAAELAAEMIASKEVEATGRRGKKEMRKENKYNSNTRDVIARVLASVGGDAEVGALVELMKDFDCREMARWALDRIGGAKATEALANAATKEVGDDFRIGAVNALGHQAGGGAIESLTALTKDADARVRFAAVDALANQSNPEADGTLANLAKNTQGRNRARIVKARLRLAGSLARGGKKDAARRIYQGVLADQPAEPQKKAAEAALAHL